MSVRKILFVTGARSEYDIIYPVLELLSKSPAAEVRVVVTGAHLSEVYGNTVRNIEQDGFTIAERIYSLICTDEKVGRVVGIGTQISILAHTFLREKPDLVFVTGDREEAISVSLTAAYLSIPVAHLAGGDIVNDGNIDNAVRYATSKFAHIHFTLLPQHAQVLRMLGEEDFRIFHTGNPALDRFIDCPLLDRDEINILSEAAIPENAPYLVLIQHPIITESEKAAFQMEQTLLAVLKTGLTCFINYPNSDSGNFRIIETINAYAGKHGQKLRVFKNLERLAYVNLLRHASCLVGNSSSGIIEAPSIGLPVVNVGSRQRDRISAGNVSYADYDHEQIYEAIQKAVYDEAYRSRVKGIINPYGDGHSAQKICSVLLSIPLDNKLIYKNITYRV